MASMSLSNWIGIILFVVVLVVGGLLFRFLRRRIRKRDGFEGIVVENGRRRRAGFDWCKEEIQRLEQEAAKRQ